MRDVLQLQGRKGALQLMLLLSRALPPTYAQSSCPAGTADLDSDGVCHQCYSYVPPTRTGHGTFDISNTLANNAAGCVRTLCFVGAKVDSIVITPETTVTTNMVASCSSEYGCYASCPGIEMPRVAYTQSRTQCLLPPAVTGMTITLNGGLEQGQQAVYTCESGGSPRDGDATRTCQAAVAPAVGYAWGGVTPTGCYSNLEISSVQQCTIVEGNGGGGDDGGFVFTNGRYVYYMGDSGVTRTSSDSFTAMSNTILAVSPSTYGNALFADASRGQIYRFCNSCGGSTTGGNVVSGSMFNQIQCLDDNLNYQGVMTLPNTYTMYAGNIFIAVGDGNVAIFDNALHWRLMSLPPDCSSTPDVTDLGAGSGPSTVVHCETITQVQTGYLERQPAGQFTMILTAESSSYPLNRFQLPNAANPIANIPIPGCHWGSYNQHCSLGVDLARNKLYTHTESACSTAEAVFECPFVI